MRAKLKVSLRKELGSSSVKKLRGSGIIPGIIYGKGKESVPVQVTKKDLYGIEGGDIGENVLLDLVIEDEKEKPVKTVIVKELQKDYIKGDWLHIDFNEISLEEKLKTKVAIEVAGEAVGVNQGGILEQIMHELEIECLPVDIPHHINVDVANLGIGQTIYVRDLIIHEKITVLSNPELPVVSVAAPKEEEEVVAAPVEGAPAEPEVIGKGKKEEEEEVEAEKGAEAKPKEEAKPAKEEKKEK